MARALVIKTYGDLGVCAAIVDGMHTAMVVADNTELAEMRAEVEHLRNVNGLRAYGDSRRFARAQQDMADRYTALPANPVIGAFLGVWALLWLAIYAFCDYARAMTAE